MLMKTETINRKIYAKPAIVVMMLGKQKLLVVTSDEYYYQGAPDDWHLKKQQLQTAVFVCIICQICMTFIWPRIEQIKRIIIKSAIRVIRGQLNNIC